MKNRVWLAWHDSSRSMNMSKAVNADLHLTYITNNIFSRHFGSSIWTVKKLFSLKPNVIFLHYSFLLLIIIDIYKILNFGKVEVIADCHTKALKRKVSPILNWLFWPVKKWSFSLVDITIIHNEANGEEILKLHSNYFVIPDKIPEKTVIPEETNKKEGKYCVNISSFDIDEPIEEVIKTAELLQNDNIIVYWTGKTPKAILKRGNLPNNLVFTGYISFEEYFKLINNASCTLVLTRDDDCLLSGAYESLAYEVPMVLSDTQTLKNYFKDSVIYSSLEPISLYHGIREAINNSTFYKDKMRVLKKIRDHEHKKLINELNSAIDNLD